MRACSHAVGLVILFLASLGIGAPQARDRETAADANDWCEEAREWAKDRDFGQHCEVREIRLAPGRDVISVDGEMNGGITITGWDRDEIQVLAKVQTWADSEADARRVAKEIEVESDGATIHAEGPVQSSRERGDDWQSWSVSYRIKVPHRSNLGLRTHNGAIEVVGVEGKITLEAQNGALRVRETAGEVRGRTTNGSLLIELAGKQWKGEGLDLVTTNGRVTIGIPKDYSAHLETGTHNGDVRIDLPLKFQGDMDKRISTDLGRGGATVRAITTNGAVIVRRGTGLE